MGIIETRRHRGPHYCLFVLWTYQDFVAIFVGSGQFQSGWQISTGAQVVIWENHWDWAGGPLGLGFE